MFDARASQILERRRVADERAAERTKAYAEWLTSKDVVGKAVRFLGYIGIECVARPAGPAPVPRRVALPLIALAARSDVLPYLEGSAVDEAAEARREARWREVGRALKRVDRALLKDWTAWSRGFRDACACAVEWDSFGPVFCDTHAPSSVARTALVHLLHKLNVDWRKEFHRFVDSKHEAGVRGSALRCSCVCSCVCGSDGKGWRARGMCQPCGRKRTSRGMRA